MIVAGTGHRPDKLNGYGISQRQLIKRIAGEYLALSGASHVISGMALGWDQALAFAALELSLPVIAAVPFKGQEKRWPAPAQSDYRKLLERCERVEILCGPNVPVTRAMDIRNEWMVDACDEIAALWNGGKEGGTWNCLKYNMLTKRRPVQNMWRDYENYLIARARAEEDIPF